MRCYPERKLSRARDKAERRNQSPGFELADRKHMRDYRNPEAKRSCLYGQVEVVEGLARSARSLCASGGGQPVSPRAWPCFGGQQSQARQVCRSPHFVCANIIARTSRADPFCSKLSDDRAARRLDRTLTASEVIELRGLAARRSTAQALALRARIVLTSAPGTQHKQVAADLGCDPIHASFQLRLEILEEAAFSYLEKCSACAARHRRPKPL